ncbi:FAD-dependent oxidoreductase [Brachybacterium tyrofermentans]|uniref:FAD-dependent oxidoreductase n=1 Tax=Brachybacterium tyrofermentans TaxID=47848 RepID=UPI003FD18339
MEASSTGGVIDCVVVGGGPAGMVAGLLLARQGVRVTVLEKHADFLRDFRGDTIHPSTMKIMDELGIIDRFLKIPHRRMSTVSVAAPDGETVFADFSQLPEPYNYVAFMPQWDFLDFLAQESEAYPTFELIREAEVTDLVSDGNRAYGVLYRTPDGEQSLAARLVLGADGRSSTVRARAWLAPAVSEAPMDVLWFRISRNSGDEAPFVSTGSGFSVVAVDRGDYWQVAYCIPKGEYGALQSRGLDTMADRMQSAVPVIAERFRQEITTWGDINLLSVSVDHLGRWYRPGLLCIGDAAHAMSPSGGVGINLAVQDAVAAARILAPCLRRRQSPPVSLLAKVQRRRELPARIIQAGQVKILADLYPKRIDEPYKTPKSAQLMGRSRLLQKTAARVIGLGLRPEHIK